ncbi:MAG: phosphoribosyl-ATP pyrophosphohydrolase [Candidatus Nanosyncoccaceae bacterium]|jgi:predicted house-cleaning noncanonical NTP pyrophosphatase (MazG superfamily)
MPKFYLRKLVRDKILEDCLTNPDIYKKVDYRVLGDEEYVRELIHKVTEESSEIPTDSEADLEEVLAELADLQSIVDALREHFGFSEEQLREAAKQKTAKKGGFVGRYYIESQVLAEDAPLVEYYRANPDRFPEEK